MCNKAMFFKMMDAGADAMKTMMGSNDRSRRSAQNGSKYGPPKPPSEMGPGPQSQ